MVSRSTPREEVGGVWLGVSPGPHPGGRLGDLQAHIGGGEVGGLAGGSPGLHLGGGAPGPHLGGFQAQAPGECIPACTEADPPKQMATAVGGMHPTGMHSCNCKFILKKEPFCLLRKNASERFMPAC